MHKFPFAAVAGQALFKRALLLAAVNPLVGGVLVSGPRGCAKSTLAKALADILPQHNAAFVTLPLGATEDMLIGTLNLEQVLNDKQVNFQSGLLAKAHKGVLYVDEVNLLADNLVDQLLDVAASGVNTVERDGISHQHDARFILLGTMNPDEGELRPQLMDRFGLFVELSNDYDIDERIEIVKRREAFDLDASAFAKKYQQEQRDLMENIAQAQKLLPAVMLDDAGRLLIAKRCDQAKVDGLRADIVWGQAAKAQAALAKRQQVTEDDILAVEALVLGHRTQQNSNHQNPPPNTPPPAFTRPDDSRQSQSTAEGDWGAMEATSQQSEILTPINLDNNLAGSAFVKANSTQLNHSVNNRKQGLAKGSSTNALLSKQVNWFASLVNSLGQFPPTRLQFRRQKNGANTIHLVLLDTSASVLDNKAFAKAKGLILQVVHKAYLQREQLALIGFGNQQVQTLLSSRRAPKKIKQLLDNIQAAGGTPLHDALDYAQRFQIQQGRKQADSVFKTYIITDGRVSKDFASIHLQGEVNVIDVEQSQVKRGKAKKLAQSLCAQYYPLAV